MEPQPTPIVQPTQVAPISLLVLFCQAIAIYEGGTEAGTIPYRCHNPGDLRWPYGAPYPYGASGVDFGDFLTFDTYQDGLNALKTYVTRVAKGLSKVYPPKSTISQFFAIYAPSSDSNNPNAYADFIVAYVGNELSTTSLLSVLLS